MTVTSFLSTLKHAPETIEFAETIAVIETNYNFTPTAFQNGLQYNAAGENSGSCKLFAFAKLQQLTEIETLTCFGAYYFKDVLEHPTENNHQNIRNFMKTGWNGIQFEGKALTLK
jgi:HopJ type III effector protein